MHNDYVGIHSMQHGYPNAARGNINYLLRCDNRSYEAQFHGVFHAKRGVCFLIPGSRVIVHMYMNYYAGPWDYESNTAFGVEDPVKLGLV